MRPGVATAKDSPYFRDYFPYIQLSKPKGQIGLTVCKMSLCLLTGCGNAVCLEHGWGGSIYDHGCDIDDYLGRACQKEGCNSTYCWEHAAYAEENLFKKCNVCCNLADAEESLGCYEGVSEFFAGYCPKHPPKLCGKQIVWNDEEDPVEPDEDDPDAKVCDFMCCETCLTQHRCGDDPTEYC
jgi:hypothetical protein